MDRTETQRRRGARTSLPWLGPTAPCAPDAYYCWLSGAQGHMLPFEAAIAYEASPSRILPSVFVTLAVEPAPRLVGSRICRPSGCPMPSQASAARAAGAAVTPSHVTPTPVSQLHARFTLRLCACICMAASVMNACLRGPWSATWPPWRGTHTAAVSIKKQCGCGNN